MLPATQKPRGWAGGAPGREGAAWGALPGAGAWLGGVGPDAGADAVWRRRFRLSLLDAQRLRERQRRPIAHDLQLFSSDPIHFIRLHGRLASAWPTAGWWSGRALQLPAFELPRLQPPTPPAARSLPGVPNLHFTQLDLDRISGGHSAPSRGLWGSGSDRWASTTGGGIAIIIIGLLVLLVKALDRCLDMKPFRKLWQRSDEWFTPNVLATSGRANEEQSEVNLHLGAGFPSETPSGDAPPPYSECANTGSVPTPKLPEPSGVDGTLAGEEPPPPYSACYVAFSNPKDGLPSVHFYNSQSQNLFDGGTVTETAGSASQGCDVEERDDGRLRECRVTSDVPDVATPSRPLVA